MAAIARKIVRLKPEGKMTKKTANLPTANTAQRGPPVRVKLQRISAVLSNVYPPDGQGKIWWARLKKALGTRSSDFVNASLLQLQGAAQLPCGGISETAMNAALAMIEGVAPQNEIDGAVAIQMACAHAAAVTVLTRLGGGGGTERRVVALASAAARLMRAFAGHVETLRRLRHGGDQYVRVEHVHINEGGQAVIGNVKPASSASRSIDHGGGGRDEGEGGDRDRVGEIKAPREDGG
jgi:hypothetical protein